MKTRLLELFSAFDVPFVKAGSDSLYYKCPFCEDKGGHLNVIPDANIWRCARCGAGGGVVHFVEHIKSCDRDEARAFLRSFKPNTRFEMDEKIKKKMENASKYTEELASEDVRSSVYERMLELLNLFPEHYEDLKRRGLSDEQISGLKFKSVPKLRNGFCNTSIPKALIKEGFSLKGVPGFFKKEGVWYMNIFCQGYFIPFYNISGKLTNLQIRADDSSKGKYMSFSSTGFPSGTKVQTQPHFISFEKTPPTTVYVTEGALKGDIACFYIKKLYKKDVSFLCIPGVSNTKALIPALEMLKENGLKRVVSAFDMDKRGNNSTECNENVKKAVNKIKNICTQTLGLKYSELLWEEEKGIDDYLVKQNNSH